jgi:hypothetical protein
VGVTDLMVLVANMGNAIALPPLATAGDGMEAMIGAQPELTPAVAAAATRYKLDKAQAAAAFGAAAWLPDAMPARPAELPARPAAVPVRRFLADLRPRFDVLLGKCRLVRDLETPCRPPAPKQSVQTDEADALDRLSADIDTDLPDVLSLSRPAQGPLPSILRAG